MGTILINIAIIIAIIMSAITLINIVYFRTHNISIISKGGAKVSVLIPARNEESNLAQCLNSLTGQSYGNYEILVLDDHSTDRTWEIISDYQKRFSYIKGLKSNPLPNGWKGKTWAQQQLASRAAGKYLFFTDADTEHSKDSIAWAAGSMTDYGLDAFSALPRHYSKGFWADFVTPALYLLMMTVLPLPLVYKTENPKISFALGQFFMFRKDFFVKIGGMRQVKNEISEDIRMGQLIKEKKGSYMFLDAKEYILCRSYDTAGQGIRGIQKNIYDLIGSNPLIAFLCTVGVSAFYFAPLLISLASIVIPVPSQYLIPAALISLLHFINWSAFLIDRKLPWYTGPGFPLTMGLILAALWRSVSFSSSEKTIYWKERKVS